jgi:hypothetical protein
MSPYVIGGLIAALTGLLVWCLTTVRDHWAEKRRQREHNRTVLRAALANYLAALDSLTLEYMDEPIRPTPDRLDRALDALATRLGFSLLGELLARIIHRMAYGRRPAELMDRMAQASAELRLVATPEVLDLMQRLDDLFRDARPKDDAWREEWRAMRENLRTGFRAALDS